MMYQVLHFLQYLSIIYEDTFMTKSFVLIALLIALSACAYNPAFYEETRKMDNTLHNKSMGWFIVNAIKDGE